MTYHKNFAIISPVRRGVAQFGSAHGLGPWGRGFKSLRPDHKHGPLVKGSKTPAFHAGNRGSNPLRVTKKEVGSRVSDIRYGRLAQLGEHLPYKQGVTSSSLVPPTKKYLLGAVVEMVTMPACQAGGRGFKSRQLRQHLADVAQLVEQLTCNQQVIGSSPIVGSIIFKIYLYKINNFVNNSKERFPSWPKGADCKSAGVRLHWFESSPLHHHWGIAKR